MCSLSMQQTHLHGLRRSEGLRLVMLAACSHRASRNACHNEIPVFIAAAHFRRDLIHVLPHERCRDAGEGRRLSENVPHPDPCLRSVRPRHRKGLIRCIMLCRTVESHRREDEGSAVLIRIRFSRFQLLQDMFRIPPDGRCLRPYCSSSSS